MKNAPNISVCIVNWNTKELIYECIKSIHEMTHGVTYEIIVVDNDSKDGSVLMVKREFPDCMIIASKENLGFAKGNNLAVKHAAGNYILYLNPDTKLATNALYGMFCFLQANNNFGAVGCRLIDPTGRIQYTCASRFPTPWNETCEFLLLNRIFSTSKIFSSRELDYWDHQNNREVECLSGACIMVRREVLDRIGSFEENLFMYAEDLDLCCRILRAGFQIFYLASEVIVHYEGAGTRKRSDKNFAALRQKESNCYFLEKNFGSAAAQKYRLAVFAGALARMFLAVLIIPIHSRSHNRDAFQLLNKYGNLFLWSIGLKKIHA